MMMDRPKIKAKCIGCDDVIVLTLTDEQLQKTKEDGCLICEKCMMPMVVTLVTVKNATN
jgi:hypothetical protein